MFKRIYAVALLAFIASGFGSAVAVADDALELKTADQEVNGTRDIEAGNYDVGIGKLERELQRTNHAIAQAPVLINLCVAYAAIDALEQASDYCTTAIENGSQLPLAYNNRAVVNVMNGDTSAGVADLEQAALLRPGKGIVQRNLVRARAALDSAQVASTSR